MQIAPDARAASNKAGLVVLAFLSLGVTAGANGLGAWAFPAHLWIARACVLSSVLALVIYLSIRPDRPFAMPRPCTPWRTVAVLSGTWLAVWLLALVAYAMVRGEWIAYVAGAAGVACFVVIGPLQEELFFRGAIFELADRAFGTDAAPILISTALFSLYHLQLHHFHMSRFLVLQLAFTLPMGMVFARLRRLTDSIWPGFVLHVLTNAPSAFGVVPHVA